MPDTRAVNALGRAVWSARDALTIALHRAGYDPAELTETPDTEECPEPVRAAILRWRAAEDALAVAQRQPSGWSGR